jgi:hypothetical protein
MRGFLVEDVVIKTRRIKLRNLFEFSRLLNVGKVEVEMMWRGPAAQLIGTMSHSAENAESRELQRWKQSRLAY